jgi:hypothetical protein
VRDAMFENQGRDDSEAVRQKVCANKYYLFITKGPRINNLKLDTSGERFRVSDSGAGTPMIISFVPVRGRIRRQSCWVDPCLEAAPRGLEGPSLSTK